MKEEEKLTEPLGAVGLVALLARRALEAGEHLGANADAVADLDRRDLVSYPDGLANDFFPKC